MSTSDEESGEHRQTSTIAVPTAVHERIERRLSRSEFDTADEYATFVLE